MKNILFTDMDGTLLLSDCTVSEDMRNAMKKAVDAGHGIVLTSGRPLASIQERIVKLGLDFCNDYIISFGGALIWDCKKSQPLRSIRIRPEAITKITGLCKKYGIHVQGYSDSAIVGMVEDEELAYYRSRVNIPYVNVPDIAEYLTEGSYKLQIIHLTVHEKLEELKKEIVAIAGDEVDTFFSSPRYLEVLPKGVSKGDAVKFLSDYLSMPRSCTFTAGDEDNDISMLEAAGHGVALYNAAEKVKAAADIVTTRDNNHDGLLEIFEKYFN